MRIAGRRGFTLIEMIVVLGVSAVLLTMITVNLLSGQRSVTKTGVVEQIVADIRSQQSKAMMGENNGTAFGVHINEDNYVLFNGATYNAADNTNFAVNLDNNIVLSTAFPNANIVFSAVSGEVTVYVAGQDTITIADATDDSIKILHINRYGVVDTEN